MKNIICAANPIKETLSSGECLDALAAGVAAVVGERQTGRFVVSDGGDGFLEAVSQGRNVDRLEVSCTAPLGDVIQAPVLIDRQASIAFVESATCCGISLVEPERRNVMVSGTAGLADVLAEARNAAVETVYVGLGGTATCDGGVGFLWRLACLAGQFLHDACEPRVALDLVDSASPDLHQIRNWMGPVRLIACVDVDNPLLGMAGAARVYGPQKGATPDQVDQLEGWMAAWCQRLERNLGPQLCDQPGAGAAGGLGLAMMAIGAEVMPGSTTVAEMTGLSSALGKDSHVITNEGRFDQTSFRGKAPWAIAEMAVKAGGTATIYCAVADPEAAEQARAAGVKIIEFGRDMPEDKRRELTAESLRQTVEAHLRSEPELTR